MIELESMAVEMPEVKGHPNRVDFLGVLTVVDVASTRAPSGSDGKRVLLTKAAAEAAIPSLIGMALDYSPSYDRHDIRRKVGVITHADIVGRNLEIRGYLYAKDFPDVIEEIAKGGRRTSDAGPRTWDLDPLTSSCGVGTLQPSIQAGRKEGKELRASLAYAVERLRDLTGHRRVPGENAVPTLQAEAATMGTDDGLGMSYEVTKVQVADRRARVWILTEVTFTGAAVLRRNKAAYQDTWIELA